jgi:integrase
MARPATGQVVERDGKHRTTYALRFRAYGERRYVTTLATSRAEAAVELENVLADVRRGIWREPVPPPVEESQEEPTVHVLASEWFERRRHAVDERTVDHWRWALTNHVLPFFERFKVSEVTVAIVDRYKTAKLAEREELVAQLERWQRADPKTRGRRPAALSNESINKTIKVLAQVLDDAVDGELVASNVARGRKRRLKAPKPRRTWLKLDEVSTLLDHAGHHRALLATLIRAGLRVSELCALRWRAVDLTRGILTVEESKTDAGERREIDLTPMLLDELKRHRGAGGRLPLPDALVFPTSTGRQRDRHNVRSRILLPAVARANTARAAAGLPPIADGITNHTCRRTYASLLYEAGASPAYVMAQMGHESSNLPLEVYAKVMERKRDTGERMDDLIRGADWARMGTNAAGEVAALPVVATENPG